MPPQTSMFTNCFLISSAREAEMASSKPFTFDWSDIPICGDHDSYSSPPSSTSVQHVNTYPPRVQPSTFRRNPKLCITHPSNLSALLRRANSSLPPTEISATQILRFTKSNEKRVSFSSILEIRTLSMVTNLSCLGHGLGMGGIDAKTRNCRLEDL
jgi:hypothetical protein